MADEWKPKIIGIICNWCSYAGADGAGSARTQYPPDVRIVRVMCTGRIDTLFVLKAKLQGSKENVPRKEHYAEHGSGAQKIPYDLCFCI